MSWAIGYDSRWCRDIGYGVPATCDHPGCGAAIDRGLAFVCGSEPYGGDHGCGLYFCHEHRGLIEIGDEATELCERCEKGEPPFDPTHDTPRWAAWKLTHDSWAEWRNGLSNEARASLQALADQVEESAVTGGVAE